MKKLTIITLSILIGTILSSSAHASLDWQAEQMLAPQIISCDINLHCYAPYLRAKIANPNDPTALTIFKNTVENHKLSSAVPSYLRVSRQQQVPAIGRKIHAQLQLQEQQYRALSPALQKEHHEFYLQQICEHYVFVEQTVQIFREKNPKKKKHLAKLRYPVEKDWNEKQHDMELMLLSKREAELHAQRRQKQAVTPEKDRKSSEVTEVV